MEMTARKRKKINTETSSGKRMRTRVRGRFHTDVSFSCVVKTQRRRSNKI